MGIASLSSIAVAIHRCLGNFLSSLQHHLVQGNPSFVTFGFALSLPIVIPLFIVFCVFLKEAIDESATLVFEIRYRHHLPPRLLRSIFLLSASSFLRNLLPADRF